MLFVEAWLGCSDKEQRDSRASLDLDLSAARFPQGIAPQGLIR